MDQTTKQLQEYRKNLELALKQVDQRLSPKGEEVFSASLERRKRQHYFEETPLPKQDLPTPEPKHPNDTLKRFSFKRWKFRRLDKKYPHKTVLVHLHLNNGNKRFMVVKEEHGGFIYNHGKYIFDNLSKKYNVDARLYEYTFHENLCIPVKYLVDTEEKTELIHLPINEDTKIQDLRDAMRASGKDEVINELHPNTLKNTIDSEVIRQLVSAQQLSDILGYVKIVVTIILIISVILLLAMADQYGLFENLGFMGG